MIEEDPLYRTGFVERDFVLRRWLARYTRWNVEGGNSVLLAHCVCCGSGTRNVASRLLDYIVDPSELHGRVADLAQALAANAPLAIQGMKHALNRIAAGDAQPSSINAAWRRASYRTISLKVWRRYRKSANCSFSIKGFASTNRPFR